MKDCAQRGIPWTRGRFFGIVGVLFALQAGLIFLFGERTPSHPISTSPMTQSRVLDASVRDDQLLRQFFVGDPAIFSLPNRHGFSGRGWLNQRPLGYQDHHQLEPPQWLGLNVKRLGTNFPGSESMAFDLDGYEAPRVESPPDFLPPEIVRTNSVFRLEGSGLGERLLGGLPSLPVVPSEKLLTNSVVQIAVDAAGEVVAARLDSSCGSPDVDAVALTKARALRFLPRSSLPAQWGEAVFEWQTTEAVAAGPPK